MSRLELEVLLRGELEKDLEPPPHAVLTARKSESEKATDRLIKGSSAHAFSVRSIKQWNIDLLLNWFKGLPSRILVFQVLLGILLKPVRSRPDTNGQRRYFRLTLRRIQELPDQHRRSSYSAFLLGTTSSAAEKAPTKV